MTDQQTVFIDDDPLWYKDAIIYEVHVRAFYDSDGDGIGDFRGLTQKLDYLADLGVTAIWLLPFYPSPLKDDGYDIADYNSVNPSYGTLRDVKVLVREAHRRGLRVITELVCNHTSDQHPWFQSARRAPPGSAARNFYVWSDTSDKYKEVRIIFKDTETSNWSWDPVADAYYWHRFFSHQPDLNFDNPRVQAAIFKVMEQWLEIGIDGLRLDAVPYLYERDGTSCENLPETHAFLKKLRAHLDARFPNRMLLSEANQWPEDAVAYFGDGDECHMNFHFPLMPRLFMSLHLEDRYPIIDILQQTPPIPENAQWALFLRNHDELTLEMVTDEERDYMYRVYAADPTARINLGIRRRLAPLLGNNRRRIELMNGLLFALPGTPVMYYGDEIGMGDNIYLGDRNGVRTPMQWSPGLNAGFSEANRQRLYFPVIVDPEYHYESINVASQQNNPQSLLWWTKRLIALRKRSKAFGRGTIEFLQPANRKVLAFVRRYENETILVIANLSRYVQAVELDLSAFQGMMPVEMFGRVEFPAVADRPYFITLGPHAFYWFTLEPQTVAGSHGSAPGLETELPALTVAGAWESLLDTRNTSALTRLLTSYLPTRTWFLGRGRGIREVRLRDTISIPYGAARAALTLVSVDYTAGDPETYVLPLAYAADTDGMTLPPEATIARLRTNGKDGTLYDATWNPAFCTALLETATRRRDLEGRAGDLAAKLPRALRYSDADLSPHAPQVSRHTTSVTFGDQIVLKLFRRVDEGVNPDVELGRFLNEHEAFDQTPAVLGSLDYGRERSTPLTVAALRRFVPNEGDAWDYTLDTLKRYLEDVAARQDSAPTTAVTPRDIISLADTIDVPPLAVELCGPYLEAARQLGRRTAEMHIALASGIGAAFAPEPFTPFYQRSLYQSMRNQANQAIMALRGAVDQLPEGIRQNAQTLLSHEDAIFGVLQSLRKQPVTALRTRIHGDYGLEHLLYTGTDFTINDFEGEMLRSLPDRRLKRSPVRDVASMLHSFQYAVQTALSTRIGAGGMPREQDQALLEPWGQFWRAWVSSAFLRAYLQVAGSETFLPHDREQLAVLLEAYMLDRALYGLIYELNNRPEWTLITIKSILELAGQG